MCGIIGYVGPRAAKPLLIQGLERLEYRGYDSAGIALLENDGLEYVRAVGNLQFLKQAASTNGSGSTTGLGHTRWATHGAVTEGNAHPLTACEDGQLAIVLNGIVENYRELKERLKAEGHTFSSETDAETVSHLIEAPLRGRSHRRRRQGLRGARGPLHVRRHPPRPPKPAGRAPGARRRSSWASGSKRTSSASNAAAFLGETRNVIFPDDGDIVSITPDSVEFVRADGQARRARAARARLGRRERREGRLRDLHAQGDLRAARVDRRDDRRPDTPRKARPRRPRDGRPAAGRPPPYRHPRLRHRVPRRRRRPLRARGVGPDPCRAGHRLRVDLPEPGDRREHPGDRDLAVGRDARHGRCDAAGPRKGRPHRRDHEHDGLAHHPRGRLDALHALRARSRRRCLEDVHGAGRAALPRRPEARRDARHPAAERDLATSSTRSTRSPRRLRGSSTATTPSRRSHSASTSRTSSSTSAATSGFPSRSRAR